MGNPNWVQIKNEYITTSISQRKLAQKHNVSASSIAKKSSQESWHKKRIKAQSKITAKLQQKNEDFIVQSETEKLKKLHYATDLLIEKILLAIGQLDSYIVSEKKTIKKTEYKNDKASHKPTKETVMETEKIKVLEGNIDRAGLRAVASALKDMKDVIITTSDKGDGKQNEINDLVDVLEVLKNPVETRELPTE